MAIGWDDGVVRLAPLDAERHFDNALRWINDPLVTEWLLAGDFPVAELAERRWFESAQAGSETEVHFAIEAIDGTHLGFSGLHRIQWRHGVAQTGTLIGAVDRWGQGFGTAAARLRAGYAFDVLGLRALHSSVLAGNERSLRMQLRAGYEVCGRIPAKFWKRGAYRDEILTCLSRERWREIRG